MEKMDSEPICQHRKVFAPLKATDRTNLMPWICALCGHEGTDTTASGFVSVALSDYELIKAKKATGAFNVR